MSNDTLYRTYMQYTNISISQSNLLKEQMPERDCGLQEVIYTA